jgi:exodeoxyribonuclease-1
VVIANLKTLTPEMAQRWGIDMDQALRHADEAARHAPLLAGMWADVFERPPAHRRPDVDEDLYGGFVGNEDRRALQRLRTLSPEELADRRPAFADLRLDELLFRYRARNFPDTLNEAEREQWQSWIAGRLCDGTDGALDMRRFHERIATLETGADARARQLLAALRDYARAIAPDCR